jgi:hypothetical protein
MRKLWSLVLLSLSLLAVTASAASAQTTIGELAPGTSPFLACTNGPFDGTATGPAAAAYTVPTAGVITSWSTNAGEGAGQQLTFKVYRPLPEEKYLVVGHDGPRTLTPSAVNTFATDIPVQAGDLIGNVDVNADTVHTVCDFETGNPADTQFYFEGDAADGSTVEIEGEEEGFRLNETATLLPPPAITTLGATTGSTTGGTSVAVSGSNFAEVKSVSFGSTAASSFAIDSEGQITAVSPVGSAGSVPISVTTVAGTATSSQQFTYQAPPPPPPPPPTCTVPKLKGKTLKASKKKIKGADCKVGKVTKKKGAKAKSGKVVGQSKKPGTVLPAGTVVKVTLGKA